MEEMRFTVRDGEYEPPATEQPPMEVSEGVPGSPEEKPHRKDWMRLQPGAIRFAFRFPGEALAWKTGFEPWCLSERDLEDIVQVYEAMEIYAPAWVQALIVPSGMYLERFAAYRIWKAQGSPEAKGKVVGATPEREPEGR